MKSFPLVRNATTPQEERYTVRAAGFRPPELVNRTLARANEVRRRTPVPASSC
jgi:hypothetical protein